MRLIQAAALSRLVADIFTAAGCSDEEAARIAKYLVAANLAGHDSHGVIRAPRYVEWLEAGRMRAGQTLKIITENEVMALVDGAYGFGQTIGPQAVQLGIDKAAKNGISIVALRCSGHLGRIGDWPEMAAEANQVSIHFVNMAGSQLVAPFGGVDRRMSTNPVAIGVPVPDGPPVIHDFATALVAEGKVLVASKGGKPLPAGSLIDPDGEFSTDPRTLYGDTPPGHTPHARNGAGSIRAMGEHKGSGLAFMCELLAGALTGSGCAGPGERRIGNGMLSIYMDLDYFTSDHDYALEVRRYIEFFKSARPAQAGGEVLLPGEAERRTRAERLVNGVPLPEDAWLSIRQTGLKVGLDESQIDTLFV